MTMNSKAGKVALVTGASLGIGQGTAELLAKAGCKVYGTSRRGGDAGERSFEMLPLDVTRDESVETAVQKLMRFEGRIDLLVNNAGFGVAPAGAEEGSIEQARSIFDTNFFGIVRMTRAAVNQRVKEVMATAEQPGVVAEVALKAASVARPKLRYAAGGLASRLQLLRRFAPAGLVDAGIRRGLRLDAMLVVKTS